jgi:alkylation response protein AidB-like acyl-CoA dehydrogenase
MHGPSTALRLTRQFSETPSEQHEPAPTGNYERVPVHREDAIEVVRVNWQAGGDSPFHGHGDSAALCRVLSGKLEEERFIPSADGYSYERSILTTGDCMYLPPGSFHRIRALEAAVTIHSYSPAPDDARETPSDEVLQEFEAAREAVRSAEERTSRVLKFRRRAVESQLLDCVDHHLAAWAQRETDANAGGELTMPSATLDDMRSSGILAAPVPRELGGWGSSLAECVEAIRQLSQQAPATALALVMPFGNAATTRIPEETVLSGSRASLNHGKAWIAEQACLGRILAVANSEPGAGGDLANTKTTAERGLDGIYRLSGRKSFATFGRDADYFLCAARRSDANGGRAVIDGFFIARDASGLEIDDRWNPVGMRPTASVGLTLEQTPAEAILGYPGCLEGVNARHWSTLLFAAVFLGVGQGALQEGIKNTPANAVWGRAELAECSLSLDAALGYLQSAAANEPWPYPSEAQSRTRRVKTFVARVAVETATKVAMISGGRAYTPQHPVFRYLCDALAGPLLRPPLPQAMDSIVQQLFPESVEHSAKRAAA